MSLDGLTSDVRVILGGKEIVIVESYNVAIDMMTQPAQFSVQVGNGAVALELIERFPARTEFQLQIAGTTQFSGFTDGWSVSGGAGNTSVTLTGRDTLAAVHDATAKADKAFKDVSLEDLVRFVLDETLGAGKYTLASDGNDKRLAMANASGKAKKAKKLKSTSEANRKVQLKFGMKLYGDFLKPQLDRAGVFLFSTQGGTFILAPLEIDQTPLYRLRHRRGDLKNTVESFTHSNNTTGRYAACEVWGRRGGGGKEDRKPVKGRFVDEEMTALGFTKTLYVDDPKSVDIQQCEFLAKRRIAEANRSGWQLSYTVGGHTTQQTGGGGTGPIIWIPDTLVDVDDEDLGITGPHYIEGVTHAGQPDMTTTIKLMRLQDVVFGEDAPS